MLGTDEWKLGLMGWKMGWDDRGNAQTFISVKQLELFFFFFNGISWKMSSS